MFRATWWSTRPDCWPRTAATSALRSALGRWCRFGKPCSCCAGAARWAARTAWPATRGISQATGYRYLHEGIDVLVEHGPDLHDVLDRRRAQRMSHVILAGTLISCDRVPGTTEKDTDLWYSGKAKHLAGNIQFIAAPDGTPL